MAVLNEISVGRTLYQEVDDIPTHSAVNGTIAFDNINGLIFQNVGGTSSWYGLIEPRYGRIYYSDNGTTVSTDTGNTSPQPWTLNTAVTYTKDSNMKGFTSSLNGRLSLSEESAQGKYLALLSSSTGANSTSIYRIETGVSLNSTIPQRGYNGTTQRGIAGSRANMMSNRIVELNYVNNGLDSEQGSDNISLVKRIYVDPGGGNDGYFLRHSTIQIFRVAKYIYNSIFNETFETATFSTNWTVANAALNKWIIGTAEKKGGSYSAYISSGTVASYSITTTQVSHFYRNITFPNINEDIFLRFDWKCWGENLGGSPTTYDYGAVVITDTSTTPVAGTEVITTQATTLVLGPTGNGRIGADTNLGKFNLNYGGADTNWRTEIINMNNYKGLTKRLVFTWRNDNLTGNNPPFVLDNIRIQKKLYI